MRLRASHLLVLLAATLFLLVSVNSHSPRSGMPGVVLWAWQRPENLSFVDGRRAGVAFLVATARLDGNGNASFQPRTVPLIVPADVPKVAVVRIESPPQYTIPDPAALASGIAFAANLPDVRGVEIDFDAHVSERLFYRHVIEAVRARTARAVDVTALASWCSGDHWLDAEPVGEAVPMFFRMGRNETRNMAIESPACATSAGVSLDEPWPARGAHPRRVYVFNPRPWTRDAYEDAIRRVARWK